MKSIIELAIQVMIIICIAFIIIYLALLTNCREKYLLNDINRYKMCPVNYSLKTSLSEKGKFNLCLKNKQGCMSNEEWTSVKDISPEKTNGCYLNSPCICSEPKSWKKVETGKYICK